MWMLWLELFLLAIVANTLSALSGGGAGLIQFPALIFLGLPFGTALGTHKIASVALGLGACWSHLKAGTLQKHQSMLILASGLPGVVIGSVLVLQIPDRWAQLALGSLTLGLALYSMMKPTLGQQHAPRNWQGRGLWLGMSGLFVIGVLNGSVTSGTGLFLTVWLVRWFGLDYRHAVAYTLVLCGVFWNGCGAAVVALLGSVAWHWLPPLLLGSLLGGYLGTRLGQIKGNRWIKIAFEWTTFAVGCKLIWSAL
jgi:uncharacterized protein